MNKEVENYLRVKRKLVVLEYARVFGSNLEAYLEKSIEISQNIHKYWQLSTLEEKRKIQKMVFPEGIVVDTTNRIYLTFKVNSLFLVKSQFIRTSEGIKKELPIKSDEESSLVDKRFEISNLDLVKGLKEVVDIWITIRIFCKLFAAS